MEHPKDFWSRLSPKDLLVRPRICTLVQVQWVSSSKWRNRVKEGNLRAADLPLSSASSRLPCLSYNPHVRGMSRIPLPNTRTCAHTPADTPIQGLLLWRIHRAWPCTAAGQLLYKGGGRLSEENCNRVSSLRLDILGCYKEETLFWCFSHWCEPGLFLSSKNTWISWILGLALCLLLLSYQRSSHSIFCKCYSEIKYNLPEITFEWTFTPWLLIPLSEGVRVGAKSVIWQNLEAAATIRTQPHSMLWKVVNSPVCKCPKLVSVSLRTLSHG